MYPLHIKDVLLGILAAYVAVDLLLAYSVGARHPGVLATIMSTLKDENIGIVLAIGLGVGILTYHFARKSRERFSIKNNRDTTTFF